MRSLRSIATLIATAAALWSAAALPAAADANVVVDGAWVTLGHITGATGTAGAVRVAPAPAPGGRSILNTADVAAVARANGVNWNPQGLRNVTVERSGVVVPKTKITDALATALGRATGNRALQPDLIGAPTAFYVPTGASPTVAIENLEYDAPRGMFTATVVTPASGPDAQRTQVRGRAVSMADVPVLINALAVGTVIQADDIGWASVRTDQSRGNVASDPSQLVGQTLKRHVRANEPIRLADVQAPVVVAKNSTVMMVVEGPGLQLSATGRALEDAGVGAVVHVINSQTHQTVEGVVEGPGRVRVTLRRAPVAIAAN